MTGSERHSGRNLLFACLGVVGLAFLLYAYYPLVDSGPGEGHSLLLLEHGAKTPWWRFWEIPVAEGPRIVMYASFSLQHALFGLKSFSYYFLNLLVLWVAGLFVAAFCYRITANAWAAVLSAMIFWLYDSVFAMIAWLSDRQEPMVVIFGLGALLYVMRPNAVIGWAGTLMVFVLLCLSVFSKEYGLVFVAGVGWYVLVCRRDLLVRMWVVCAAVAALLLYARQAMAVGVYQHVIQCEDMGYMWDFGRFCTTTDLHDPANLAQLGWNLAIGLLSQVVPSSPAYGNLFIRPYNWLGQLSVDTMRFSDWLASVVIVLLFVVAIVRRMPFLGLCLIMILADAVLSAPFFRSRNVLFGFVSTTVILSYGAMSVAGWLASRLPDLRAVAGRAGGLSKAAVANAIVVALYAVFVFYPQMGFVHQASKSEKARKSSPDYVCRQATLAVNRDLGDGKTVRADIIEAILEENGLSVEGCDIFKAQS